MKFVKYFLQKRSVTILLLLLVLGGGLLSYVKMGKLEDAPFTINQALVLTPYPGASPSEVQSQVTDVLEESIQSLGELYYLKTENRAGLSKITVYVKKEIRADEMQQLWDKLSYHVRESIFDWRILQRLRKVIRRLRAIKCGLMGVPRWVLPYLPYRLGMS